jgi:hypothetical protein
MGIQHRRKWDLLVALFDVSAFLAMGANPQLSQGKEFVDSIFDLLRSVCCDIWKAMQFILFDCHSTFGDG